MLNSCELGCSNLGIHYVVIVRRRDSTHTPAQPQWSTCLYVCDPYPYLPHSIRHIRDSGNRGP